MLASSNHNHLVRALIVLLVAGAGLTYGLLFMSARTYSSDMRLESGGVTDVVGTGLAMHVPDGFRGEATVFLTPPFRPFKTPPSKFDGIRYFARMAREDADIMVTVFSTDEAYQKARERGLGGDGSQPDLAGTPFSSQVWTGTSHETSTSVTVDVFGRDVTTGQGVRIGAFARSVTGEGAPPIQVPLRYLSDAFVQEENSSD